jgi:hypothetical protein
MYAKWIPALLVLGLASSGCSASIVVSSDTLGGVQEGPRWGIVKYLNQGADSVIEARASNAREKMAQYCSPLNYKVTATSEKDSSMFLLLEGSGGGGTTSYLYIRFECVNGDSDEPTKSKKNA